MSDRQSRTRQVVFGLGLLATWLHSPLLAEDSAIPWEPEYERAATRAREQGRPLWVHFTGPWCGSCRQMEATTFVSTPVIRLAREQFVSVAVRSDLREDLVGRFGVTGLPTDVILAPDGQVLAREVGYVDPPNFAVWLRESAGRWETATPQPRRKLGLSGYCPVSLVRSGVLRPGQATVTAHYDGRRFRFVDPEAREAFLKEPERYLPGDGGHCVVHRVDEGQEVPGDPRFGVYYKGRLYLCADALSRQRFAEDPDRYAQAELGGEGYCPHCRAIAGRLVKGRSQFSLMHEGRRYLFPDADHREAFRSAPDRYLR